MTKGEAQDMATELVAAAKVMKRAAKAGKVSVVALAGAAEITRRSFDALSKWHEELKAQEARRTSGEIVPS